MAQLVAGLAVIIAPVFLRVGSMLVIPSFGLLFWTLGSYLLVRIARGASPRWWLAVGLVAGLGLLHKHSMLLWGAGAAVGLLVTPLRSQVKTRWPWLGLMVAFVLPLFLYEAWVERKGDLLALLKRPWWVRAAVYGYCALALLLFPAAVQHDFIYFQF